jgi:hypothetical protein
MLTLAIGVHGALVQQLVDVLALPFLPDNYDSVDELSLEYFAVKRASERSADY